MASPNSTAVLPTTEPKRFFEGSSLGWIVSFIVIGVLLCLSFYLLVGISLYIGRRERVVKERKHHLWRSNSTLMKTCIMAAIIFEAAGCIANILSSIFDYYLLDFCYISKKIRAGTVCGTIVSVYSALWFRQRLLYSNPVFNGLTSATTRMLSKSIGILLLLFPICNVSMFIISEKYVYCIGYYTTITRSEVFITLVTMQVLIQASLLLLFLIPMIHHRRESKNVLGTTNGMSCVIPAIRRAFNSTVVCVISDVTAAILMVSFNTPNNYHHGYTLHGDMISNIFATIACLQDWRLILFPWSSRRNRVPSTRSVNTIQLDAV